MTIFSLKESKAPGEIPDNCKQIIKKYAENGMFDSSYMFKSNEFLSIYFLMTQDCQGKCPYCYQPKEFRCVDKELTQKVIDDTMTFLFKNFPEQKIKFSLFGGEPLLNFDMVKYIVENYSMIRTSITTNGLAINDNPEIKEFLMTHSASLNVSVSVGAQKFMYPRSEFIERIQPAIEVIKATRGDAHFVVDNPTDTKVLDEIKYLYDQGIVVRCSTVRHSDTLKKYTKEYIELFKKIADYIYFDGKPRFGQSAWYSVFKNNIYKRRKGIELQGFPPTFCGCGSLYIAVNHEGDIYPCDFFANYPEFKMGSVYEGINETALFFVKMKDWLDGIYEDCKNCTVVPDGDIRLCPRAMCLAENYTVSGNPLKPASNHCAANAIEFAIFDYIAQRSIETGIDEVYFGKR